MSGHWRTTIRPSGSTAPIPASGCSTFEPCWPIATPRRLPLMALVAPALDLSDIQGFVLRGYMMPMVRHFLLTVRAPAAARQLLGRLVSGDESDIPQITTAGTGMWGSRPDRETILPMPRAASPTIASTSASRGPDWLRWRSNNGSRRFRSSHSARSSKGPHTRAELVGDTGASSPRNWVDGFGSGDDHVLVTLHAISPDAMTSYCDRLCAWFVEGDAFEEIWRQDGMALHGDAGWPTRAHCQSPLRIHRRHHDAHHSRRPRGISARSPTAVRAMALRLAGRRGELRGTRAAEPWA